MGEPRAPLFRFLTYALVGLLVAGLGALLVRDVLRNRARQAEANERARASAAEKETNLAPATSFEVWAAGFRASDGSFCRPCNGNPTLLYSTSDSNEVRELVSILHYRRTAFEGEEVKRCGPLTISFLWDGKIIHSSNLKPYWFEKESWASLEAWARKRDLFKKAADATTAVGLKKNP